MGAFIGVVLYLAVVIFLIAATWKVFAKAGKPGWAAIVPIYNTIVLLEIVGKPLWWIILLLIPIVNIIVGIMLLVELARVFGKGVGFGVGLFFLWFIFWPILGFGSAKYVGPGAKAA